MTPTGGGPIGVPRHTKDRDRGYACDDHRARAAATLGNGVHAATKATRHPAFLGREKMTTDDAYTANQSAILRQIENRLTPEWNTAVERLDFGSIRVEVRHRTHPVDMVVRITKAGAVTACSWHNVANLEGQRWDARTNVLWADGSPLTFGWEHPARKDIVDFCLRWIDETTSQRLAAARRRGCKGKGKGKAK